MTNRRDLFHGMLLGTLIALMGGCAATSGLNVGQAMPWGEPASALAEPTGLSPLHDGGLLVADSGHNRIVRLDADGRVLDTWGRRGAGPGEFRRPLGLSVGADGRVLVADYLNDRVQVLGSGGRPIAQWATFGKDERFNGPADVAVDGEGNVYVVEFNGSRVIKLDHDGNHIRTWGAQGHGRDEFYYPTRIAIGPDRRVWVTDAYNHRLKVYTADGELVRILGEYGDKPGQFNVPGGVAFDPSGGFWVADFFNSRLQHFADTPRGKPEVTVWTGEHSRVGHLRHPTDLTFSQGGRALYVVEFGHNRLVRLDLHQTGTTTWNATPARSSLGRYWY